MPADALDTEGVQLLVVEKDEAVLAVGGLKHIGEGHGELKSMHTSQAARGLGLGRSLLTALIEHARHDGMSRLSLETGTAPLFEPARTLYTSEGFELCAPFADYVADPNSVFMTRAI